MSLDLVMFLNRSRSLSASFTYMSSKMSTKSNSQTHYNTLGVDSNATQNEIKAAYFKLTKQCHPDINKHESAKKQFQNISEAYQVIGNYNSRKHYDRVVPGGQNSLNRYTNQNVDSNLNDMRHNAYKYSANSSNIYNFDEWTRAHYGKQIQVKYLKRMLYKNLQRDEYDTSIKWDQSTRAHLVFMFIVLSLMIWPIFKNNKHRKFY